ncbi:UNVERIFIED_CONTAM: hypothetical protein BEN50_02810 [Euhalothece sp. KZN 001]
MKTRNNRTESIYTELPLFVRSQTSSIILPENQTAPDPLPQPFAPVPDCQTNCAELLEIE